MLERISGYDCVPFYPSEDGGIRERDHISDWSVLPEAARCATSISRSRGRIWRAAGKALSPDFLTVSEPKIDISVPDKIIMPFFIVSLLPPTLRQFRHSPHPNRLLLGQRGADNS